MLKRKKLEKGECIGESGSSKVLKVSNQSETVDVDDSKKVKRDAASGKFALTVHEGLKWFTKIRRHAEYNDGFNRYCLGGQDDIDNLNKMTEFEMILELHERLNNRLDIKYPPRTRETAFICAFCNEWIKISDRTSHISKHLTESALWESLQMPFFTEVEVFEWYDKLFEDDPDFRLSLKEMSPTDRWVKVYQAYEQRVEERRRQGFCDDSDSD